MTKYNSYTYCLGPNNAEHKAQRDADGFTGGNVSTDGNWIIGDLGNDKMHMVAGFDADNLPQYAKDLGITKCCLSHEEALNLVNSEATSDGASDGWKFTPEELS